MNQIYKVGDTQIFERIIKQSDLAKFDSGTVHEVYSTFALARDAEWACRLFVLEMKEEDEEGIGTFVNVRHIAPAFIGSKVKIVSQYQELTGNELICSFQASVEGRIIAEGTTGQKIILKEKIEKLFKNLKQREL